MSREDLSKLGQIYTSLLMESCQDNESDEMYDYLPEYHISSLDELQSYIEENELDVVIGEIISDYGSYEFNMRPASTVDGGVTELKKVFDAIKQKTGVDNNTIYDACEAMLDDYYNNQGGGDGLTEDDIIVSQQRERGMVWAALFGHNRDAGSATGHLPSLKDSHNEMMRDMKRHRDGFE